MTTINRNIANLSSAFALILIIFISGCVDESVKEVNIPGHPAYTFSNSVKAALGVPSDSVPNIRFVLATSDNITVIFNGTSAEDNSYFTVTAYNIVTKIQTFFAYSGRVMGFDTFYFIDDQWFNSRNEKIDKPAIGSTAIWLKGPNTGAAETSVRLDGRTIYVQGTDYKNLTLAADKLVLILLGINE